MPLKYCILIAFLLLSVVSMFTAITLYKRMNMCVKEGKATAHAVSSSSNSFSFHYTHKDAPIASKPMDAKKLKTTIKDGEEITVYYNPVHPSQCVLANGEPYKSIVIVCMALAMLLLCIGTILFFIIPW